MTIAACLMFVWLPLGRASADQTGEWPRVLTRRIPKRASGAPTGFQFVQQVATMDETQREQAIEKQLLDGNIPAFLRWLKPVHLQGCCKNGKTVHATLFVTPDYLSIGSQADFIRIPMNYRTAIRVANQFGFILPTCRVVDAIYNQSAYHFTPRPMTPGPQMRSTRYYQRHNCTIQQECLSHGIVLGRLVSGHKKDVVISNRLLERPERIAIYGWHRPGGKPIQPLSIVHGAGYADYSHGIRLISEKMIVDGQMRSVYDILKDPQLARLLTDEGPMAEVIRRIRPTRHLSARLNRRDPLHLGF